jgi:hypothetical protein
VPRDLPLGGEGYETFTDGALASLLPRALSHRASLVSGGQTDDTGLAVGEARVPGGATLPVRWPS